MPVDWWWTTRAERHYGAPNVLDINMKRNSENEEIQFMKCGKQL